MSIFGISIPNPVKLVEDGEHLLSSGANDFASAMKGAAKAVENMSPSEIGHTVLNVAGMVPVIGAPADAINAGWYAAQGDWANATLSAATAIPGLGDVVGGERLGATALKLGEDGVKAERLIKDGTEAASSAKNAEKALDAAKTVDGAGKGAEAATDAAKVKQGGIGPVRKGEEGVQKSINAAEARGETVLGREITFEAPNATRTRVDVLTQKQDGGLVGIESKNGPKARLRKNQKDALPQLKAQGGTPRGKNAEAAGLEPGQPMGPIEIRIDRH